MTACLRSASVAAGESVDWEFASVSHDVANGWLGVGCLVGCDGISVFLALSNVVIETDAIRGILPALVVGCRHLGAQFGVLGNVAGVNSIGCQSGFPLVALLGCGFDLLCRSCIETCHRVL